VLLEYKTLRPSSDFTPSPSHLQHTHFSPPRMKLFRITHLADMMEGELCGRSFIAADPRIYDPEFTHSGQDSASRCIPAGHGKGFKDMCHGQLFAHIAFIR